MAHSTDLKRERHLGIHLLVGFQGSTFDAELKAVIRDFRIGGIVLFRRNIHDPEQLKALLMETQIFAREALGRPLWVAVDQEGGPVQRLTPPFTQLPSAQELSAQGMAGIREWTAKAARDLRRMGIQINLAPVLDVVSEGSSHFMKARSLGPTPEQVALLGQAWIQTLQDHGISATAKHYPGLGRAESDPHHYAPVIRWKNEEDMQRDLLPFHRAIQSGVHCFMTSHALYPYLDPHWPATLSPIINKDWLRDRLGFQGVLLSDDLDMAAVSGRYGWEDVVRQGLRSSMDFFLLCQCSENIETFYRALARAIAEDPFLEQAHIESLARIGALCLRHDMEKGSLP